MKNLDLIVKLSDIPFIQERWKSTTGDYVYHREHEVLITMGWKWNKSEDFIYLPLGFNPETGNYQLDDLILEAGKFESEWFLPGEFRRWCRNQAVEHNIYDSLIIAKLTWLNELVEGKP